MKRKKNMMKIRWHDKKLKFAKQNRNLKGSMVASTQMTFFHMVK